MSKGLSTIFHRLKKLVMIKDFSYILNFIDLAVKKDYFNLCSLLLDKHITKRLNLSEYE